MSELTYYCDHARHLVCKPFSISNLHRMAEELGIDERWYHASSKHPHYDIPLRRREEIEAKCVLISSKELFRIIHEST